MNPRVGVSLSTKLAEQGAGHNAFVLDEQRLAKMQALIAKLPPEVAVVQGPPAEIAQAAPDANIEASGLSSMSTSAALSDPTADSAKVQEIDIRNLPAE